jgi:hypothetical protein
MTENVKKKRNKKVSDNKKVFSSEFVEYEIAWNESTNLSRLQFGDGILDIQVDS